MDASMRDVGQDVAADYGLAAGERLSVRELYDRALAQRGFTADAAQAAAVEQLQRVWHEWSTYKNRRRSALRRMLVKPALPRGFFLWGGVGRGKSFLMDSFYLAVPVVRKARIHFHHFMRDVHRQMAELRNVDDPLMAVAERIARKYRLICFDEFHVNDIADAMILGRLLERTMDRGVVYCMTSNYHPDELYRDGLRRDTFLPTIALIRDRLDVIQVDGGQDYRRLDLERLRTYHSPAGEAADQALADAMSAIAGSRIDPADRTERHITLEGREVACRHEAEGVIWFDFAVLCGWGRSQNDYLEIARRFPTVIVSDVPRMGLEQADLARRFTLMVDVFYDTRVTLLLSAEAVPEQLLRIEGEPREARLRAMKFEFDRTASRLTEMQTADYRAAAARSHGHREEAAA
jgi:cell division protein ZapE